MSRTARDDQRGKEVSVLMETLFEAISLQQYVSDPDIEKSIEVLFSTSSWGFREVTLVVAVARLLDPSFKASEDFYSCNPRPLFEKHIKKHLDLKGIPARQSGPLNVAKGAQRLNLQWAAGREPRRVAEEVVRLIERIEQYSPQQLQNFTKLLLSRFLQEAITVQQLSVESDPITDPEFLFRMIKILIEQAPDYGNTPQRIVGYLLESYHDILGTRIRVQGHTDRASTTSITSKKLGDITEELLDGIISSTYEVTVKSFGTQRVREAYEAVLSHAQRTGFNPKEIVVLCREEDVHPEVKPISSLYLGKLEYQDITFYFVNIYEWFLGQLLRMNPASRRGFFMRLQEYVDNKDTAVRVKYVWAAEVKRILEAST
jgi:hypothetical protein